MYKCEICGREIFKKHSLKGYKCLCSKHMHQLHTYGKFLDSNPRTAKDLNEIINIEDNISIIKLYDGVNSNVIGECIIDSDDINKVKYHKWRISHGRVVTGSPSKGYQKDISHFIIEDKLKDDEIIDHINGNPYDNRKNNLRICTQSKNTFNKHKMSLNTSGVIGVSRDKRRKKMQWHSEIRYQNIKIHLGSYISIEEAAYARYCAEIILFKEYRNTNDDEIKEEMFNKILTIRKSEIENFVKNKIHNKIGSV